MLMFFITPRISKQITPENYLSASCGFRYCRWLEHVPCTNTIILQ